MPREVTDKEGTIWSCVQAYAGLRADDEGKTEAAVAAAVRVEGANDLVEVIATPSGGARTARLQLKIDWEKSVSDEELLNKIEENR